MTRPAPAGAAPSLSPAVSPDALLTSWLSTACADDLHPRLLRLADGRLVPLDVARWAGPVSPADESLLVRSRGPVLDVGCGPGRLTAVLHARGVDVLGVELLKEVPVLARRAGAPVVVGDVFGDVPRAGQWQTVLLADGNVGIGGDAPRLLRRARDLLAPAGQVLVELHPEEGVACSGPVRLEGLGVASAWFPWAVVGRSALPAVAGTAGLDVAETWDDAGRTFAALVAA